MHICEGCLASKCSLSFKITVIVRENTVMQNSLEGSKALQLARARGDSQSPTALLSLACCKLLSASEADCKVTLLCLGRMGADEKNQILDRVHTTRDFLFTPDAGLARVQLLCILLFKQVLQKQSCSACRFIKSRASSRACEVQAISELQVALVLHFDSADGRSEGIESAWILHMLS